MRKRITRVMVALKINLLMSAKREIAIGVMIDNGKFPA
jgi:hypothetical protein